MRCKKNNYISSMDFELYPHTNHSLTINQTYFLKRQIRIKSSRLPHDFFTASPASRYEAAAYCPRDSDKDFPSRDVRTPSFQLRKTATISQEKGVDEERKVQTARASLEKAGEEGYYLRESLMQTRRILKSYRKQSANNKTLDINTPLNRQLRLPKLFNKTPKIKNQQL